MWLLVSDWLVCYCILPEAFRQTVVIFTVQFFKYAVYFYGDVCQLVTTMVLCFCNANVMQKRSRAQANLNCEELPAWREINRCA